MNYLIVMSPAWCTQADLQGVNALHAHQAVQGPSHICRKTSFLSILIRNCMKLEMVSKSRNLPGQTHSNANVKSPRILAFRSTSMSRFKSSRSLSPVSSSFPFPCACPPCCAPCPCIRPRPCACDASLLDSCCDLLPSYGCIALVSS